MPSPRQSQNVPQTIPFDAELGRSFYTPLGPAQRNQQAVDFAVDWTLSISLSLDGVHGEVEERTLWAGAMSELKSRWSGKERKLRCAGIQRSSGTISNHLWTGYPLRDVLLELGVSSTAREGWHVHFESSVGPEEEGNKKAGYGCSLPLDKIMATDAAPNLLAFEANSRSLTTEHGAPLRLVTPGLTGARSVKWLEKIRILPSPSPRDAAEPQEEYGLSCTCFTAGPTDASGFALGANGVPIEQVAVAYIPSSSLPVKPTPSDVRTAAAGRPSSDWKAAALERGPPQHGDGDREWGWVLWSVAPPFGGANQDEDEMGWIVAKCIDRNRRTQEREGGSNVRGQLGLDGWSVMRWTGAASTSISKR